MADQIEHVEVKRMSGSPGQEIPDPALLKRSYNAFFPIIGGLILDFADLATFGPIGLFGGMLIGGGIGWLISGIYDFSPKGRMIYTLLAGIYCTIPGTFFIPLATIISAVARFSEKPKSHTR
ncbi:hypothetical protein ACFL6U_18160 [Planctomycetota bacterium]